jgi:tRNA dimethylallyltransferase
MTPIPVLIISGPTASGKTDLAHKLALKIGGEIINVDTVQCYTDVPVASCCPPLEFQQEIPYHLYGFISPVNSLDAGKMMRLVTQKVSEVSKNGRIPILVGSSGMYLSALLTGLSPQPTASKEIRLIFASRTTSSLYSELVNVDPNRAAMLHPNDRQRIERALEVSRITSRPQSELFGVKHTPSPITAIILAVMPERIGLRSRIAERSREMLSHGLIDEVEALTIKYSELFNDLTSVPLCKAIGVSHTLGYLRGEYDKGELYRLLCRDTAAYAKRQITFWRQEPRKRDWARFYLSENQNYSQIRGGQPIEEIYFEEVPFDLVANTLVSQYHCLIEKNGGVATSHQVWYLRQVIF